jgi:DNA-binding GntR family transcriptional regulator
MDNSREGRLADPTTSTFRVPAVIATELAQHLEEQIVYGDLAPGARLIEEDLVRKHDVSRSPVRESFRLLEQDGLVARESRRGVRVSPISLADLNEVYTCRLALEALAAETAAAHRTDANIAALRRALADLEAAFRTHDPRQYFRCNVMLTDCIHAAAGNATLSRLLRSIGKQSLRYRYLAYRDAPEMLPISVEGNQQIIDAIVAQRARHARTLTEDLIQISWNKMKAVFADK